MKSLCVALLGVAFLSPQTTAVVDPTGVWRVEFVGSIGPRPRTIGEMLLELHAEGSKLTGVAHMNNWPDCAYIPEGTITGDRVSFIANGRSPFSSNGATGYPKLRFTGTIEGDRIKLIVNWGSVFAGGSAEQPGNDLPMEGRRLR